MPSLAVLAIILLSPGHASAGASARGELDEFFQRAMAIRRDATSAQQARDDVRGLASTLFDGRTAARQALGGAWSQRTAAERDEFTRAFTAVLERAYLEIVEARLPRDRPPTIRILSEDVTAEGAAIVRTKVRARDGGDVQLDYRMIRPGKAWMIRDVAIDGVGLVDNYRAQFAQVLRRSSYSELLGRLRTVVGMGVAPSTVASPRFPAAPIVLTRATRDDRPSQTP
jgi:phospholipid transport system substrate-binding protein